MTFSDYNEDIVQEWTFLMKTNPDKEIQSVLVQGEVILQCYKTVRDQAALTNKRLLITDRQGVTGKKMEIFSLPYRSIEMWSSENTGPLFMSESSLDLWTRLGHFRIKLNPVCDIRQFDQILGTEILS